MLEFYRIPIKMISKIGNIGVLGPKYFAIILRATLALPTGSFKEELKNVKICFRPPKIICFSGTAFWVDGLFLVHQLFGTHTKSQEFPEITRIHNFYKQKYLKHKNKEPPLYNISEKKCLRFCFGLRFIIL